MPVGTSVFFLSCPFMLAFSYKRHERTDTQVCQQRPFRRYTPLQLNVLNYRCEGSRYLKEKRKKKKKDCNKLQLHSRSCTRIFENFVGDRLKNKTSRRRRKNGSKMSEQMLIWMKFRGTKRKEKGKKVRKRRSCSSSVLCEMRCAAGAWMDLFLQEAVCHASDLINSA